MDLSKEAEVFENCELIKENVMLGTQAETLTNAVNVGVDVKSIYQGCTGRRRQEPYSGVGRSLKLCADVHKPFHSVLQTNNYEMIDTKIINIYKFNVLMHNINSIHTQISFHFYK